MDAETFKKAAEEAAAKMPPPVKLEPLPPRPLSFMSNGKVHRVENPPKTADSQNTLLDKITKNGDDVAK